MSIPTYTKNKNIYNYISFCYWNTYSILDVASIWDKPTLYFGTNFGFGKTDIEIRKNIKLLYNNNNIKLILSVFGNS
jgi:hypothetical protein